MKWRVAGTPGKYRAVRTACRAGQVHASKGEAARCDELHLLQVAGEIRDLRAHPQARYHLRLGEAEICVYVADFVYVESGSGFEVVEDAKGFRTPEFRIKKRLMQVLFGIDVREVRARRAPARPRRR